MFDFLSPVPPVYLTLICTLFTWGVTALGAATVFFFKHVNKKILNLLTGFAAGVMIAASFWSLLSPAVELSEELFKTNWFYPSLGFVAGGLFVVAASVLLDKFGFSKDGKMPDGKKRSLLLVTSITLHNIPEGLSVGVAFGAIAAGLNGCDTVGAVLLAFGIGLQNFPEGASVSLPLRREGMSRGKAFFFGQASGFVEPLAALLGFFLSSLMRALLPFALGFSAGAMIAVAAAELLPESAENKCLSTLGCVVGFTLMTVMDLALG